jgi:hypothetical protein
MITKLITALYVRVAFYALWKTLAWLRHFTENEKRKSTKWQTTICKTLHRKLKIEQPGVNWSCKCCWLCVYVDWDQWVFWSLHYMWGLHFTRSGKHLHDFVILLRTRFGPRKVRCHVYVFVSRYDLSITIWNSRESVVVFNIIITVGKYY